MPNAQPGLFAAGAKSHYQLEARLHAGADPTAIRLALARILDLDLVAGAVNCVLSFGPALWKRLAPSELPEDLVAFAPVEGPKGHRAPSTQRDLWIWLAAEGADIVFDAARAAARELSSIAELELEQPCFLRREGRDLTGFIDGTENPPTRAAPAVALVPDGQAGAGGAFAMTQKWVHDLERFHALEVSEQEKVIGRTRLESVELSDESRPLTAHISRVVIEENGEELEIYRRSVPYGTLRESGLFFMAFAREPSRFSKMLARMFGTGDGLHDRLVEFTRPVTGSFWFTPSLEALERALDGA